jgi:hypothetical protein
MLMFCLKVPDLISASRPVALLPLQFAGYRANLVCLAESAVVRFFLGLGSGAVQDILQKVAELVLLHTRILHAG